MLGRVLAGSLALFCFFAHAQSVQIYGIADTSIEYLTNVNAARDHMSRMPTLTGLAPSRLGFRGTERSRRRFAGLAVALSAGGTVGTGMSQSGIAAGIHHKF